MNEVTRSGQGAEDEDLHCCCQPKQMSYLELPSWVVTHMQPFNHSS